MKAGDLVVLNSGGPLMTVEKIEGLLVLCSWDSNGERQQHTFKIQTLTPRDGDQ